MIREIRIYPDDVLKKKAEVVTEFNEELEQLVNDMFETMYKRGGVGLAANQIGILKKVVVIDLHSGKEKQGKEQIILINPEIVALEGEEVKEEGCLSLPGLYKKVKRAAYAKVKAQNLKGEEFIIEGEGLLARAFQHEIDHLNGIVFIDRLSPLQRRLALEKYKKLKRKYERKMTSQK
ncbi:Peptide deformylase [Desulfurobacterium thermolithotrophum DSM 11699]|uniref:Peptide deformylase n=1 Tax=Desulfurobacterium thermolithotrophum (strain DSM 11699 / BSA) TaxID=868864 RepID=F0S2P5_DESTD|nr:peptide deformylase [Desulfurobacterium thermolithotrophum]ADY73117.1 Peptide deformylase [Desulfurobacterium thermolithotrophum DSM 11699]